MSGGNILVPIVAHVVYDFLTFVEVHQRATAQLKTTLEGNLPQKEQARIRGPHRLVAATQVSGEATLVWVWVCMGIVAAAWRCGFR